MAVPELWQAACNNNIAAARRCISRGDNVDDRDRLFKTTPLQEAAQHPEMLLLLLAHGADIQATNNNDQTALHKSAEHGSVKCTQILIALGADINAIKKFRRTPLMVAAVNNHADIVKVLMEAGADFTLKDKYDLTALDMAEERGYKEVVSAITDHDIINWRNLGLSDSELELKLKSLHHGKKYKVLLLNCNWLTSIPDLTAYHQLDQLEVLNVSWNELTEVVEDHIPSSVIRIYLGQNNIHLLSPELERYCYRHLMTGSYQTDAKERNVILQDSQILSKTLQWNHADLTDTALQNNIGKLNTEYRCSVLLISNNKLTQLPDLKKYPQFSDLKVIDVSHNELTVVHEERLPRSAKIVNLANNNIQTMSPNLISDWLYNCYHIKTNEKKLATREIYLHGNPIGENLIQLWFDDVAPAELNKFLFPNHNIKNIDMKNLPATVEEVNLNYNMMGDLPDIKHIRSLKQIRLCNNKLHTIPELPKYIVHIDLDNNSLQSVKNLSNMKKLKYLSLNGNQIVVIFGLGSKLQSIHIKGNPIRILHNACFPSERVYNLLVEALTEEQIDGLQQPPPQIFRRGYNAVIQYYEQTGLQNNSKNRMCLLGEATAGKTSLMQSLVSGVACLTAEDDRTQVVDTHTWNISDNFSYQIFDQGGHPIYSITNMFFMSADNKNVICHNIRDGSMEVTLDVLQRTIHLHPTSEIHFGLTKADLLTDNVANAKLEQFKYELNEHFKKQIIGFEKLLSATKYGNLNNLNKRVITNLIKGYRKKIRESRYFLLSSKLYKGIIELKQFLCELAERDMITLPELWWKCYTHIDSLQINVITMTQFEHIFNRQNILQKLKSMLNFKSSRNDILSCLRFYHDCGLVLWFEDHPNLKRYIFHQLQYLINILKALFHHALEDSITYDNNSKLQNYFQETEFQEAISKYQTEGLMSYKLLSYLWHEYQLGTCDQDIILELIKSFYICYQIKDPTQDEEALYFFPWLTQNNKLTAALNLSELCVVNDKTLTLLLECIFYNSVPVNLTEMFIVCLQRHAVENHYLGTRYAWKDGLLVTVGYIKIYVIRHSSKSTLCLGVRGEVDDLFEMWNAFAALHESLCSIIVQWHGVVRSLHVVCPHCVLVGSNPPHFWPTSKVFPEKPCSMLRVSCEKDNLSEDWSSIIPAVLVTLVKTDDKERHINEVRHYLQHQWIGNQKSATVPKQEVGPLEAVKCSQESLQLHNKQKEFDDILRYRGTYVLRQLLLKQVRETWGHDLQLLLQDTSGGVITKTGPTKDVINKFQVHIYQNKLLSLYDGEKNKLKERNVQFFDITLISKLLKVPKISGIEVTQSRWNDFQKRSVEDMLYPKKPGPPARQEDEESTHVKVAGLVSVIISYRNEVHNKTDHIKLNKEASVANIHYLSLALNKLMVYVGITESEIMKHDDTQLVYTAPLAEAIQQVTELNKSTITLTKALQEMSGLTASEIIAEIKLASAKSSVVQSDPQLMPANIQHAQQYALSTDHKLTSEQISYISGGLVPCVCRITIAGNEVGSGFVVGKLRNTTTGHYHYFLLTSCHLGLAQAFLAKQTCQADFGFYHLMQPSIATVNILPYIFAISIALDYVLVHLDTSTVLDNFLSQTIHLGGLITRYKPCVNDPLVIMGHPQGKQLKIDPSVYCVKSPTLQPSNTDHSKCIFYQCCSFHGASGSPCFSVAENKLCGIPSGGLIGGVAKHIGASSDVEYSVHLWEVISDIRQQIMALTIRQTNGLTVDELYQIFPHVRP